MLNGEKKIIQKPVLKIVSSATHENPYKQTKKRIKDISALGQDIMFLALISKHNQLPITQYFLEKALESLLTVETN